MRRILSCIFVFVLIISAVGCGKSADLEILDVSTKEIMTKINKGIAEESGLGEEMLDENGNLKRYQIVDLTSEEENPFLLFEYSKDDLDEGFINQALINIKSDEIIVLKAKDKSNVEALKEALENEKERNMKIWENYLPDQREKVENTIIKTKGNYLLYVTNDYAEKVEEIFDNALQK